MASFSSFQCPIRHNQSHDERNANSDEQILCVSLHDLSIQHCQLYSAVFGAYFRQYISELLLNAFVHQKYSHQIIQTLRDSMLLSIRRAGGIKQTGKQPLIQRQDEVEHLKASATNFAPASNHNNNHRSKERHTDRPCVERLSIT